MISLRPARSDDAAALAGIAQTAYRRYVPRPSSDSAWPPPDLAEQVLAGTVRGRTVVDVNA